MAAGAWLQQEHESSQRHAAWLHAGASWRGGEAHDDCDPGLQSVCDVHTADDDVEHLRPCKQSSRAPSVGDKAGRPPVRMQGIVLYAYTEALGLQILLPSLRMKHLSLRERTQIELESPKPSQSPHRWRRRRCRAGSGWRTSPGPGLA